MYSLFDSVSKRKVVILSLIYYSSNQKILITEAIKQTNLTKKTLFVYLQAIQQEITGKDKKNKKFKISSVEDYLVGDFPPGLSFSDLIQFYTDKCISFLLMDSYFFGGFHSIKDFADKHYISHSVAYVNFRKLSSYFSPYLIFGKHGENQWIKGSELNIRSLYAELYQKFISKNNRYIEAYQQAENYLMGTHVESSYLIEKLTNYQKKKILSLIAITLIRQGEFKIEHHPFIGSKSLFTQVVDQKEIFESEEERNFILGSIFCEIELNQSGRLLELCIASARYAVQKESDQVDNWLEFIPGSFINQSNSDELTQLKIVATQELARDKLKFPLSFNVTDEKNQLFIDKGRLKRVWNWIDLKHRSSKVCPVIVSYDVEAMILYKETSLYREHRLTVRVESSLGSSWSAILMEKILTVDLSNQVVYLDDYNQNPDILISDYANDGEQATILIPPYPTNYDIFQMKNKIEEYLYQSKS